MTDKAAHLTVLPGGRPGRRTQVLVVDVETGELIETGPGPRRVMTGRQFMAEQTLHERMATEPGWTPLDLRLMSLLLARLDYENLLQMSVQEMAENLDASRVKTSNSLNRLIKRGIVLRGPQIGRSYTYRLSPEVAWKGKSAHRPASALEAERRWFGPQ